MTKRNEFFELYKHPNWQRKRLEVMERAGFACERCGDVETTLNVHHSYYQKGKSPWEYPAESLHCLCEPCHEYVQELMERTKLTAGPVQVQFAEKMYGYAMAMQTLADFGCRIRVESMDVAWGVGNAWQISGYEVMKNLDANGTIDGHTLEALLRRQTEIQGEYQCYYIDHAILGKGA